MLKKINLKNKTALVTGAGKGLGKACAIALAEAGAKVVIISRTISDLIKVEKEIKKTKGSCLKFECDVTDLDKFKNILNKINKLDILELGSLELVRDWSFAGDVASAIYLINNSDYLENFVIGSGTGVSIAYVVETIFNYYNLEYNSFVKVNESLLRSGDPSKIISDPKNLVNRLGWNAQYNIDDLIERLVKYIG